MLALLVAAMDSTVVGTALPTIGGELGNFSLYPWVFSGYLLTATTTVPLWGRLADVYGRKRVLMVGMAIFIGGSVLCGSAPGMLALVLFRGLQGVGAGCLIPVTLTVVGDLFPTAQRARVQGLFGGMWGVASVIGPAVGALFVSSIGWRWIFEVNVPAGLASVALLWSFHDRPAGGRAAVDYTGAILLTAGVATVLLGLGSGSGTQQQWPLVVVGLVILAVFVAVERRSASPTVPLRYLRHPVIGPAVLVAIASGTLMFGLTSYIPFYVQVGLGASPYQAGAAVTPLLLGWSVVGIFAGRLMIRVGYERLALGGSVLLITGTTMLLLHPPVRPAFLWVGICILVIGAGMGALNTPLLIVIQGAVGWGDRGAVTALNQFSRTIGGAVGVALMGLLLESRIRAGALVADAMQALVWVFIAVALTTLLISAGIVLNRNARLRAAS
jgi:EmrB/QacA subfamily drug resistance transporter